MSMIKLFYSDEFDPAIESGICLAEDIMALKKSAAIDAGDGGTIFGCSYDDLKADKDHVGIHLVGLGASERYGMNRNFDEFPKKACIDYHHTFVKHGHVFKHHRNKDANNNLGQIKASAYNHKMDRVELFIHANKDRAAEQLSDLEKTGEASFSMACSRAGTMVLLPDYTEKPIELVRVGDMVLTHNGNPAQVSATMERDYSGDMATVSVYGTPDPLEFTADHKFHVRPCKRTIVDTLRVCPVCNSVWPSYCGLIAHARQQHDPEHFRFYSDPMKFMEGWVKAKDVRPGDFVRGVMPVCSADAPTETVEFAELLGWYLAEGSTYNYGSGIGVDFSLHSKETGYANRICELARACGYEHVHVYQRKGLCQVVRVRSTDLYDKMLKYGGKYSYGKTLDPVVLTWPAEHKRALVSAHFSGDGNWNKITHRATCCTVSRPLAVQICALIASCGVRVSLGAQVNWAKGKRRPYIIALGGPDAAWLAWDKGCRPLDTTRKCGIGWLRHHPRGTTGNTRAYPLCNFIDGGYIYRQVRKVSVKHDEVCVYNLTVDDPVHSYIAGGIGVANCLVPWDRCNICGQKRAGAGDPNMCDHLRYELGKLNEDGTKTAMVNEEPDFFDISFVGRPADRIAWNLKVASGMAFESIKAAEYEGVTAPDALVITTPSALRKLAALRRIVYFQEKLAGFISHKAAVLPGTRDFYFYELRKSAGAEPDADTVAALRGLAPKTAMALMAQAGVLLPPIAFFKYAMGPAYASVAKYIPTAIALVPSVIKSACDRGDCQTLCNDTFCDAEDNVSAGYQGYARLPRSFSMKLADAAIVGAARDTRIIETTITGNTSNFVVDKRASIELNTPESVVLAAKYAAYELSAIDAILSRHNDSDTDLDSLAATAAAQNLMQ